MANHPLFKSLSADEQTRVLAGARVREVPRGGVLYTEGEPVHEVLLLGSGLVKVTKLGASGAVVILGLAVPDDVLGAATLLSTGMHTATAEAVRSCWFLALGASVFKRLMAGNPALLLRIVQTQAEWLRELEERFHEMASDMVGARVARQLARLHEKIVQSCNDPAEIHFSQQDLAQMTGTNHYAISRLVSEWEGRGIVTSRRQGVTVRDVQSLRELYDRR